MGTIGEVTVSFVWHGEDDLTSPDKLVYSYKLVNYDPGWSDWSSNTMAVYLLALGDYTFQVRARDEVGNYPAEDDPNTAQWSFEVFLPLVAYPNPCYLNQGQIVRIANLPFNSRVEIYSLSGELVRTLEEGVGIQVEGGLQEAVWDGRNEEGQQVARSIYICLAIGAEGKTRTTKIAVIK